MEIEFSYEMGWFGVTHYGTHSSVLSDKFGRTVNYVSVENYVCYSHYTTRHARQTGIWMHLELHVWLSS